MILRSWRSGFHKLTSAEVYQIKERIARGADLQALADKYKVAHTTIWRIANNVTWKNIKL